MVEVRPYNPRRDGSIADMLWRDPKGDNLPVWPTEWTPLEDFLREWARRYADRRVSTFRHDSSVRSVLTQRAFQWCLRHLIEALAEVEVADRQADGTFKPTTINPRGQYRVRHNALERLKWSAVGRSSRARGAEVAESFEDPHIRHRPKHDEDNPHHFADVVLAAAKSDTDVEALIAAVTARMADMQSARISDEQEFSFKQLVEKLAKEMGGKHLLPPRDAVLRPAFRRLLLKRPKGETTRRKEKPR
jgi:hypothetical protein